MPIALSTTVAAPLDEVFAAYIDIPHAAERVSGISKVEMLTPGPVGNGTRFKETRVMFGKEAAEELYFTAFDPPHGYTIACDSCGAHCETDFRFTPVAGGTRVEVSIRWRSVTLFAKLMYPLSCLMQGAMKKCVQQDLDDMKRSVEQARSPATA